METLEQTTSVAARITQDVAQFNPAEAKLAHFREYLTYTINSRTDKDGQKMVGSARKEVKAERVALEKLRKAFVDDAVKYQAGINGEARRIREELEKIEAHLEAEEAKVAQWEQEEKEAIARAARERIEGRKQSLYALGLTWNGQHFAHSLSGVPTVSEIQVTGLDDGPYSELIASVTNAVNAAKDEAARMQAALIEQQRKDAEEKERQAAIAAEIARKERELKEREDAINARTEAHRENELVALGAYPLERPAAPFHSYTDEQWTAHVETVKKIVERRRKDEAEAAKRAEQEHIAKEERIRAEAIEAERQRVAREEEQKRAAAERAEEERKLAEAKMSDRKKLEAYIDHLLNVEQPEMKSAEAKHAIARLRKHLMEFRSAKI